MLEFFANLAGLVGHGLATWVRARRERARIRRLRAFVARQGWTYQADAQHLAGRRRGAPFGPSAVQRAKHLITGEVAGHQVAAFELEYGPDLPRSSDRVVVTVVMLALPTALPELDLTPETAATRIATSLGGQDIRFESEEFNRRWRVQGAEPKAVHDVVHPRLIELLLAGPVEPVRFEGTDVWTWHAQPLDPAGLEARFTRLARVVETIPRHVWQDYGYDPDSGAVGVPEL